MRTGSSPSSILSRLFLTPGRRVSDAALERGAEVCVRLRAVSLQGDSDGGEEGASAGEVALSRIQCHNCLQLLEFDSRAQFVQCSSCLTLNAVPQLPNRNFPPVNPSSNHTGSSTNAEADGGISGTNPVPPGLTGGRVSSRLLAMCM